MPSSKSRLHQFINKKKSVQYEFVRRQLDDPLYIEDDPSTHYKFVPLQKSPVAPKKNQQQRPSKKNPSPFMPTEKKTHVPLSTTSELSSSSIFKELERQFHSQGMKMGEDIWIEEVDEMDMEMESDIQSDIDMNEKMNTETFIDSGSEFSDNDDEEWFSDDDYDYQKHIKSNTDPDAVHISSMPSYHSTKIGSKPSLKSSTDPLLSEEIKSLYTALENSDVEEEVCDEEVEAFFDDFLKGHSKKKVSFQLPAEEKRPSSSSSSSSLPLLSTPPSSSDELHYHSHPSSILPTPPTPPPASSSPSSSFSKNKWYRGVAQFDEIRRELKDVPILRDSEEESDDDNSRRPMDRVVCSVQQPFDCMSMVTSLSTTANRPKVLRFQPKQEKKREVVSSNSSTLVSLEKSLNKVTLEDSSASLEASESRTLDKQTDENEVMGSNEVKNNCVLSLPQVATKEEKKEWKQKIKQERREKRQVKKALKLAFKEEKKQTQRCTIK